MDHVLELRDVSYYYKIRRPRRVGAGQARADVLINANCAFRRGYIYALVGPSGTGKTTTLSLLGALEAPKSGQVLYKGMDVWEYGAAKYRRDHIGFVFQEYNLLNYLSAYQNVIAAIEIAKNDVADRKEYAYGLLRDMQLDEALFHKNVGELSGGEQQRAAIARALAANADIILADEPTGNLDDETAIEIIEAFKRVAHESDKCVIMATHSGLVKSHADYVVSVKGQGLHIDNLIY
ncbi:MAG: ATP-binding cassette domain-containing protein [Clostridiales Family XIII bacterium]|jgi:putative ABC transport system ATP-binding protein|nr:ATP-binding cassette domain-containing protein [Clostridiales Family XIII bacterium]